MSLVEADPKLESLLEYLKTSRGFDFTGYKRPSLTRRIQKRMMQVGVEDFGSYLNYLEVHPDEFTQLFNTILINVTSFFRDNSAWDFLAEKVIPSIIAAKNPEEPIRVWTPGCATGEEAYSLAMVLAEALGPAEFLRRVKIYATDVDEEALAQARAASYTVRQVADVAPDLLAKHFERVEENYVFRPGLRRVIIFGRHDLIQDAPISHLDLLSCRNTLMYLNSEIQGRILARFHFALNDTGFLFLGRSELLLTHANLFAPVDLPCRIFSKVPRVRIRDRLLTLAQAGDTEALAHLGRNLRVGELVFENSPVAHVVVDRGGNLILANGKARALFHLAPGDLGRPLQDLELSYRPVEVRSLIDQAYTERQPVRLPELECSLPNGKVAWLEVQVVPLRDNGGVYLGASLAYTDVSEAHHLQAELQQSKQGLETAYEELQSTNEELETTNEELQSTVEELETTNEELQSTNEEMETMNEELQATNEEMQTLNDELSRRSAEVSDLSAFLQSILTGIYAGVIVVDQDLAVRNWNSRSEDLWGLRSDEVQGKSLAGLDIGLPVEPLLGPLRDILRGGEALLEVDLEATNRRGKTVPYRVTLTPRVGVAGERQGAILLVEEQGK